MKQSAIAPGVLWSPPSPATALFSLGASLNLSSDATRTETINAYYLVSDLEKARCSDAARSNGLFMLQNDLKLSEWLFDAVSASVTNTINFRNTTLAVSTNVLQHEVKFQIVSSGTLNPSWTLTRVTVEWERQLVVGRPYPDQRPDHHVRTSFSGCRRGNGERRTQANYGRGRTKPAGRGPASVLHGRGRNPGRHQDDALAKRQCKGEPTWPRKCINELRPNPASRPRANQSLCCQKASNGENRYRRPKLT